MFKDLEKILKEVPILLWDRIVWRKGNDYYEAEAIAVSRKKNNKRYTIMNYNCDNMAQVLLHETLHHYYPKAQETDIEIFTDLLWKKPDYRKLFQNKIVEKLGEYDL